MSDPSTKITVPGPPSFEIPVVLSERMPRDEILVCGVVTDPDGEKRISATKITGIGKR